MVVPARSPRPQWAKTGSWRKYVKVPSNRKLQVVESLAIPDIVEQRRVKFDEASDTTHEIPVPDSSLHESKWHKKSDYELFEKDRQLTALQYRTLQKKGRPFIEREHTVRGLEEICEMDDDSQRHHTGPSTRAAHLRCVLEEQTRQRLASIYPDATMLREISCKSSREARKRSARLGEADALAGHVSSKRSLQRKAAGVMHNVSRKMQP